MRSFAELLPALDALQDKPGLGATLVHCAQSIEYSMDGYPKLRSWVIRFAIGPRVLRRFLARGSMKHDVTAPVLGAPEIPSDTPFEQGRSRLKAAVARFQAHSGAFAPHFAYGPVSRENYEAVHVMHVADHLSR